METLKTIEIILELCITIGGAVFALWIFLRDKRKETIKHLANQVIAYNCLEQEYLKIFSRETSAPAQNIQTEMRRRAEQNVKNVNHEYPDMMPCEAKKYVNML